MCRCVFPAYHHLIKKNFGAGCHKNSLTADLATILCRVSGKKKIIDNAKNILWENVLNKQKSFHGNFHNKFFFLSAQHKLNDRRLTKWSSQRHQLVSRRLSAKKPQQIPTRIPLSFMEAVCCLCSLKNILKRHSEKFKRIKITTEEA